MHIIIRHGPDHEDDALRLAQRLFARFDEAIDTLALIPTAADDFSLALNGRRVHSLRESGTPPRVADVIAALAEPGDGTQRHEDTKTQRRNQEQEIA